MFKIGFPICLSELYNLKFSHFFPIVHFILFLIILFRSFCKFVFISFLWQICIQTLKLSSPNLTCIYQCPRSRPWLSPISIDFCLQFFSNLHYLRVLFISFFFFFTKKSIGGSVLSRCRFTLDDPLFQIRPPPSLPLSHITNSTPSLSIGLHLSLLTGGTAVCGHS